MYWIIHNNIVSNKYGGNNMNTLQSTAQQLKTLDIQGLLDLVKSTYNDSCNGSCGCDGSYKEIEIFQNGDWKSLKPFKQSHSVVCNGSNTTELTNKEVAKQLLELTNAQFFRIVTRSWSEWSGQDQHDSGNQYTYFGLNKD